jgi:hypothetical protein
MVGANGMWCPESSPVFPSDIQFFLRPVEVERVVDVSVTKQVTKLVDENCYQDEGLSAPY